MTCRECLERYSDFLDERMDAGEMARCRAHLERCPQCARYHRVVRNGLELVRALPEVEPSSDFEDRLRHRLHHVRDGLALESRSGSSAAVAALVVAALVSAAAWSPLLRGTSPAEAPAPVADASAETEQAGGAWWYPIVPATSFHGLGGGAPPTLSMTFPGPYSPLIVEPPVSGGPVGRAVFASHLNALE